MLVQKRRNIWKMCTKAFLYVLEFAHLECTWMPTLFYKDFCGQLPSLLEWDSSASKSVIDPPEKATELDTSGPLLSAWDSWLVQPCIILPNSNQKFWFRQFHTQLLCLEASQLWHVSVKEDHIFSSEASSHQPFLASSGTALSHGSLDIEWPVTSAWFIS